MAFPPEFLEELRLRITLSSLIARRVKLQRRGREHTGLCPFHKEKTPSFTVNDDKAFYHCFGCGEHGDAIGFVMGTEGLSFPEAVERLAAEAGLEVPKAGLEERARAVRRAGQIELLEAATAWFQTQLGDTEGRAARDYLAGRGLRQETITAFGLGFAPAARGRLTAALGAQGFDGKALVEAGLVKLPEDGGPPRDHFFNRIMFPIRDRRGRVIGFGGRTLGDSKAKYINSPETSLFHKGSQLYNIDKALKAVRDHREVIVAEGYMDVIALAQEGFPAVVAPLGTAVTDEQIEALWRLDREPLLCLDGDAAGRRAALRAAERALPLLKPGCSLRFAFLPEGEDPDSLLKARGAQALRDVLERALPLVDILWHREADAREINTPERRAALRRSLRDAVQTVRDPELRQDYIDALLARFEARYPSGRQPRSAFGRSPKSDAPWGAVRPGSGTHRAIGRRRPEASVAWHAPMTATAVLQRPDPDALLRRREQLVLSLLVNHPLLLPDVAEDLAALHFRDKALEPLRAALVDFAAELDAEDTEKAAELLEPHLDSAALKRHLGEQGFSGVVESLQSRKVLGHGRFARPEATEEEARAGFALLLNKFRQQDARDELQKAASDLAKDLNEENLARLQAQQRLGASGEEPKTDVDDPVGGDLANRT